MAFKSNRPGDPQDGPIESRRSAAAPDPDSVTPAGDGGVSADERLVGDEDATVLDVPNMGEFSAEAARPTPLDDIAGAERDRLPKD
jgi:hypothetical protein